MSNYLCTYFYEDATDEGAEYGNIFSRLQERNETYWRTVFTFYFSCIIFNRNHNVKYLLFTNAENFSYKTDLEKMGVEIITGVPLNNRHYKKWATVKFIFDVFDYINKSENFIDIDKFIFLDTDVLCSSTAINIFSDLENSTMAEIYELQSVEKGYEFHGTSVKDLELTYNNSNQVNINIKNIVGGEYIALSKRVLKSFMPEFRELAQNPEIATEEQIFTMMHARYGFACIEHRIFRVWTTVRNLKLPDHPQKYVFLHFPSEKQFGLTKIFEKVRHMNPYQIDEKIYINILRKNIFFESRIEFFLKILMRKFLYSIRK